MRTCTQSVSGNPALKKQRVSPNPKNLIQNVMVIDDAVKTLTFCETNVSPDLFQATEHSFQ